MTTMLSLMVLAILFLLVGAVWQWRTGQSRRKALLMLGLATIIAINVAILVWPDADGHSLVTASERLPT